MKLEFLVIHCTATPMGREVTPEDIKLWHTGPKKDGHRGWSKVGYTDMIMLDGSLENLTPFDQDDEIEAWELTNGVRGINSKSRHVVYVGGTDTQRRPIDSRTSVQFETMTDYVRYMVKRHPDIKVAGHNQFAEKACPSFDVPRYCRQIGIPSKNIYTP